MSKVNHHSLKYKRQANPNKTYKELKGKQKELISRLIFRCCYEFSKNNGKLPAESDYDFIAHRVYALLEARAIWVPFDEFYSKGFLKKISKAIARVQNGEIYVKPPRKDKTKKKDVYPRKKKKKDTEAEMPLFEQDEYFYFIAGYTSGGAPYGITWEEAAEEGILDDIGYESDETDTDAFD
ncbi:MAG: hypothetical protein UIH27_06845 [Ruminococcus sp.]|nr:hypothetical protein [Ruminococcus sp.]